MLTRGCWLCSVHFTMLTLSDLPGNHLCAEQLAGRKDHWHRQLPRGTVLQGYIIESNSWDGTFALSWFDWNKCKKWHFMWSPNLTFQTHPNLSKLCQKIQSHINPCPVWQELARSLTFHIALVLFGYVWMSLDWYFMALILCDGVNY